MAHPIVDAVQALVEDRDKAVAAWHAVSSLHEVFKKHLGEGCVFVAGDTMLLSEEGQDPRFVTIKRIAPSTDGVTVVYIEAVPILGVDRDYTRAHCAHCGKFTDEPNPACPAMRLPNPVMHPR